MRLALAVVLALIAAPASAQTVEAAADLTELGWSALGLPLSVETDGNFDTREWLIHRNGLNGGKPEYRVVVTHHEQPCAGDWFTLPVSRFATVSIQRIGVIHKIVTREAGADTVYVVALDTPVCEH